MNAEHTENLYKIPPPGKAAVLTKGEKIKEWRERAGLSVETLARLAGIKIELMKAYEAAEYKPSYAMQRQAMMVLSSIEALQSYNMITDDEDKTCRVLDQLWAGIYPTYKRVLDEWRATIKELKEFGEAV